MPLQTGPQSTLSAEIRHLLEAELGFCRFLQAIVFRAKTEGGAGMNYERAISDWGISGSHPQLQRAVQVGLGIIIREDFPGMAVKMAFLEYLLEPYDVMEPANATVILR